MVEGDGPFRVVTVCTGNICRSPAAERLIAQRWSDGSDSLVALSGGVGALVGDPIQISMAHLLEQAGAYSGEFCAQALTPPLVRDADLVLGMTRRHRAAVASLEPAVTSRTFTLREFARLVADAADEFEPADSRAESLRRLVDLAGSRRRPVLQPELDDIADPYGRDLDAYHVAFTQISECVDLVAAVLAGHPLAEVTCLTAQPDGATAPPARRGWRRRR